VLAFVHRFVLSHYRFKCLERILTIQPVFVEKVLNTVVNPRTPFSAERRLPYTRKPLPLRQLKNYLKKQL
jgi:hypothetical protein